MDTQEERIRQEARAEMQRLLDELPLPARHDPDRFTFAGQRLTPQAVVEILKTYVSPKRLARIDAVLAGRTTTVATVVEGLFNTGNVSAVMRTAEALGFQEFNIITGTTDYYKQSSRTTQGADKWLDVRHWLTPADAARALKAEGYTIVATHLDDTARPIEAFDFTQRTALVFGNERDGVSDEMLALADHRCILPMTGFTQSFNISVAAAVALYHAFGDRQRRQGHHGDLSDTDRTLLRADFCMRGHRHARRLIEETLARQAG